MFEDSASSTPSFWVVLKSWFTPTVFFVVLQLMIGTIFVTSSLGNQKKHQQHQQDFEGERNPPELARSPSVLQRLRSINFYPYRSHESVQHPPEFHNHYSFEHTHEREQPQVARSPSILERLKSINLYNYFPAEPISAKFTADTTVLQNTHELETHYDMSKTPEPEKHHLDQTQVVESDEEEEGEEDDDLGPMQNEEPEQSLDEIYNKLQGVPVSRTKSDTKPASGEVPVKLSRKMKKSASTKSAFSHFKEVDIVENRRPATMREAKVSAAEDVDEEVDARADDFINKFKQQLKLQRLDSIIRYKDMITRGSGK